MICLLNKTQVFNLLSILNDIYMKLSFNAKLLSLMIMASSLIFSSCQKDEVFKSDVVDGAKPTASFTSTSGTLAITFTNTSTNVQSSYWQFGDGTTSTDLSPVHTYTVSGKYSVILKVVSNAGYAATITKTVIAAAPAAANFSSATSFGLNVVFTNASTSVDPNAATPVIWDFGDGTTSTANNPDHKFPAYGTYNVKITVTGLLGDVASVTKAVTVVNNNLLQGGDMETTASQYWKVWSSQASIPPAFGYTGAKPSTGYDGCLRFPSFTDITSNGTNELIYQAVNVTAGKQYQLSAQVKLPSGGKQCYFQIYISNDPNTWNENNGNPPTQLFMSFNTWHGWGGYSGSGPTVAIDGDMLANVLKNGSYGPGAATSGIYTATTTGTIYIGIQAGTWQGYSSGDFLIDNVSFVQIN